MRQLRPNSTAMPVVLPLLTSLGPLSTDLYLLSRPSGRSLVLLGSSQITGAAIVGGLVGKILGASALPIAITVAVTGGLALILFWSTHRTRRHPA